MMRFLRTESSSCRRRPAAVWVLLFVLLATVLDCPINMAVAQVVGAPPVGGNVRGYRGPNRGNTTSLTFSSRVSVSTSAGTLSLSATGGTLQETMSLSSSISRTRSPSIWPTNTRTLSQSRTGATRSYRITETVSQLITVSTTHTFEGERWLCRAVALTVNLQQLSPRFAAPVRSGSTVYGLAKDVTQSQIVIAVNITSCHEFYIEAKPAFTVVVNQSTGSTQADVIAILLSGDAGSSVASAFGGGLGGLAQLAQQNPQLIRFNVDTAKSGVLLIGPDPLYGASQVDVTTLQLNGIAFLQPPTPTPISVVVSIAPNAQVATVAERGAAEGIGFAVAVISILVGSSQTTMIAGRIGTVYTAIDCPATLNANTRLRVDQNILGYVFGDEKKLSSVLGGALYNLLLVLSIAFGTALVVAVAAFAFNGTIDEAMAFFRFPGLLAPVVTFAFQGTTFCAAVAFANSRTFQGTFISCCALISVFCFTIAVAIITVPPNFATSALRAGTATAVHPVHPAIKLLFSSGVWVDRDAPFVGSFGALFKEYLPGRHWFLVIELLISFLLGLVEAVLPQSRIGCVISNAVLALLLWAHVVLVIGMHPYNTTVAFILTTVVSLLNLIAAITAAVQPLVKADSTTDVVNGVLLASACFGMVKCLVDAAGAVYRWWRRHELHQIAVEWMKDSTRRRSIASRNERLGQRVRRALADSDDSDAKRSDTPSGSSDEDAKILAKQARNRSMGNDPDIEALPTQLQRDAAKKKAAVAEAALVRRMKKRLPDYDDRAAAIIRSSAAAAPSDDSSDEASKSKKAPADSKKKPSKKQAEQDDDEANEKEEEPEIMRRDFLLATGMTTRELLDTL